MGAVVNAAVDVQYRWMTDFKQSVVNYHVKESHRSGEITVTPQFNSRKC